MEVLHDENTHKFYISLDTGEQAVLEYALRDSDGIIDLYHTEVPASQRGKGVGGVMAQHALEYARVNGLRVVPTCSYIEHYLSKHPEYQDLLHN